MPNMPFELFLSNEIQNLLDDFAALLDVRVTFFSINGEMLRRGKAMCNCDYCDFVQKKLCRWNQCVSMDADKLREALQSNGIISYRCHAGVRECLAAVKLHNMPAGFVMMGQFRLDGDKMPKFPELDPEQNKTLRSKFNALPCFSADKQQAILNMLKTLIDYITVREFAVLQGDRLRNEIDKYIERHLTEDIRLPEMAKKLGRSVSSISQLLRKNYHTTFKNLVLEARLNAAEKHWHTAPDATVAEVAFISGFRDQFYFSRVFHRLRGISPGKYRDQLKQS